MMFGVGAGFQNCQLQVGIARNNTVLNAKGGSWPSHHGPRRSPCSRTTSYLQGSLCLFWVGLLWRSQPKTYHPQTARTSGIHQWDLQSLYLTPAFPWAPPRWSRKGAAWDPHRCTRAHQSLLTQSPSSGFHNEVSGKEGRGKRDI